MVVALRAKSQITMPNNIVKSMGLKEGDEFEVVAKDGGILLVPVVTYPKAYVEKLKKEVARAEKDLEDGKLPVFETVDEMMDYLERS